MVKNKILKQIGWNGLEFVLSGCVGKGALDGDRIVALNKNWQALEQEGRLADIICNLCNAPFQVAKAIIIIIITA